MKFNQTLSIRNRVSNPTKNIHTKKKLLDNPTRKRKKQDTHNYWNHWAIVYNVLWERITQLIYTNTRDLLIKTLSIFENIKICQIKHLGVHKNKIKKIKPPWLPLEMSWCLENLGFMTIEQGEGLWSPPRLHSRPSR